MLSQRTINYAIPPEGHFWKWSEGHDAIEWADGSTLALWPEVHTILGHLGSGCGLPPFGSILLLLAACRNEWVHQRPSRHIVFRSVLGTGKDEAFIEEVAEVVINGLDRIHDLPQDLRNSLPAKCHLVTALFEGGPHCLTERESELVLKDLSIFGLLYADGHIPALPAKSRFLRDIRALKIRLARHDAASLESLLRTGLENANLRQPELPEQPLEPGDPRDLLDRLQAAGGEGGAAAAVAKRTIAMMNFPGRFGSPRDLPVGGIADITNRGTIDRLLPGELAWDDLVLAARLVHNEALYFRREIPPMDVAVSHTVLLDRGLRLWGTGRFFSLGVALGLRHHPALQGDDETFEVAAATGDAFEYLDLVSPTGVRSALETLIPSPDPEKFLITWWDAAQITNDPSIPDLTFITAREHLEEDAPRRLLGEIAAWIHARNGRFRVIALTRGGGLEMQAWSPAGNRLLCRGELDLEDLLKPPAKNIPPPPLCTPPNPLHEMLPVYAAERLPFLFPLAPQHSAFIVDRSGTGEDTGITQDRRLMQWPKLGWGGEELHPQLPGRQQWLGRDDHGGIIVIASGDGVGESVRVFRWEKNLLEEIEVVSSRHPFPRHAAVSGGAVLLAYSDSIEALSLENGQRITERNIQSLPLNPSLHFDGATIRVELSSRANSFIQNKWTLGDSSWPHLFTPDKVSLEKGVLRIMATDDCLTFDPTKLTWTKTKAGVTRFTPFEETEFSPTPGVILKRARLVSNLEIWLDPRGLLHLRDPGHTETPPWSILLSTPSASVWNPSHPLTAFEPRLRQPATENPGSFALAILKDFLSAPAKP